MTSFPAVDSRCDRQGWRAPTPMASSALNRARFLFSASPERETTCSGSRSNCRSAATIIAARAAALFPPPEATVSDRALSCFVRGHTKRMMIPKRASPRKDAPSQATETKAPSISFRMSKISALRARGTASR
eukprot:Amastigsp_a339284_112.p5 type:complete len:132 gc:universal Amastigsp_a339284_112:1896-2291(+)